MSTLVEPGTAETVDTSTNARLSSGDGDHDRFAHYVRRDEIIVAMVESRHVVALCGKRWIPSRDPEKYPVCPTCKEIHAGLPSGGDE